MFVDPQFPFCFIIYVRSKQIRNPKSNMSHKTVRHLYKHFVLLCIPDGKLIALVLRKVSAE